MLKSCVIGSLPEPENIIPYTKLTKRYADYTTVIYNTARAELDNFENTLKKFGVTTYRSVQQYPYFNGEGVVTHPLAVRDFFTVYGNSLYRTNHAYWWEKDIVNSCDHVFDQINFTSTYTSPSNDIFYDGDINKFDPDKDIARPFFEPTVTIPCGNDIIIGKYFERSGNELGKQDYMKWAKSVNPKVKFHEVDAYGHIDSTLFLVRPGLLITQISPDKLPSFFDKWEKIFSPPQERMLDPSYKKHKLRHRKLHPVMAKIFYNFLTTNTEETFFSGNSLSINENTILFTGKNHELFSKLEKKGIDCVSVDFRATTFWDCGPHCSSNDLERTGDLEDYS